MFISPEVKGDLQLEQAEFQSLVSGEDVSVARKFDTALTIQWKTPGILGGNEVPNWKDNPGSILRRLVTINFGRQIADDQADPHLERKLEAEIPAILCKCLRAYLDYAHKYSDKDIWTQLVMSGKIGYMALRSNVRNIIKAGVAIENSVLGEDCRVEEGALIKDSVIWSRTRIRPTQELSGPSSAGNATSAKG
jgi:hypothetical protein